MSFIAARSTPQRGGVFVPQAEAQSMLRTFISMTFMERKVSSILQGKEEMLAIGLRSCSTAANLPVLPAEKISLEDKMRDLKPIPEMLIHQKEYSSTHKLKGKKKEKAGKISCEKRVEKKACEIIKRDQQKLANKKIKPSVKKAENPSDQAIVLKRRKLDQIADYEELRKRADNKEALKFLNAERKTKWVSPTKELLLDDIRANKKAKEIAIRRFRDDKYSSTTLNDAQEYNRNGFDRWGYDEEGYDEKGFDRWGYDRDGCDEWGFDRKGFNALGHHISEIPTNSAEEIWYDDNSEESDPEYYFYRRSAE